MIKDLILKNRSYRRYHENEPVPFALLEELVDMVRFCPSGRNAQPLRYRIVNTPEGTRDVFPHLKWAGYLKDWDGPAPSERPAAYIIVCHENSIKGTVECDAGIALQSMMLGLAEAGFGGCIIGSIQRDGLRDALRLSPRLDILYVLAIGRPKEQVVLEDAKNENDIEYWRDDRGVHHVPKRPLKEILV